MAVARLGSASSSDATNAHPHTVGAGSARCLMVAVTQEVASPTQLAVGYGGQSMSAVVGIAVGDATDQRVDIYYLNDAGITAASDNQIDLTSPPGTFAILVQAYEGAMQTTPTVVDSEAATGDSDPLTGIQIAAANGEAVFGVGGSGNTSTGVTWAGTNPLTGLINTDANATAHGAIADRLVTSTETVNHNLTFTTAPNRVAGAACLIEAGTVEGITSIDSDYGDASNEFDFDENSLDVNGLNFGASQGGAEIYLSDAVTIGGSANEVNIIDAVTTWSDTVINLDLTTLTVEHADIEALGPGARYLLVLTDAPDEYASPVCVTHRAKAFNLAASTNIAASGENTTVQLTAPSGKTTGDFGGGRIQDDENPGDAVDIAADEYREDEWCISGVAPSDGTYLGAQDGENYQFRVLRGGELLDTYTLTPGWTIGAGSTPSGTSTITLPMLTMASSGTATHQATSTMSAPLPTMAASGKLTYLGTSALILPLPTMAGTGQRKEIGTSAMTLPVLTIIGAGLARHTGTSTTTLPLPMMSATATVAHVGTSVMLLPLPALSASGVAAGAATGTAAFTLPLPTAVATGMSAHPGTATLSLPLPTMSATAKLGYSGASTLTLPLPTMAASGVAAHVGISSSALPLPTMSATGAAGEATVGTSTIDLLLPTMSASGKLGHLAASTLTLPLPSMTATGAAVHLGSGAATLLLPTMSAAGKLGHAGSGAPSLPLPTMAAAGQLGYVGTATMTLPTPLMAATGNVVGVPVTGTSDMTLPLPAMAATGVASGPKIGTSAMSLLLPVMSATGTVPEPPPAATGLLDLPITPRRTRTIRSPDLERNTAMQLDSVQGDDPNVMRSIERNFQAVRAWIERYGNVERNDLAQLSTLLGGQYFEIDVPASAEPDADTRLDHSLGRIPAMVAHAVDLYGRAGRLFAAPQGGDYTLGHNQAAWTESRAFVRASVTSRYALIIL